MREWLAGVPEVRVRQEGGVPAPGEQLTLAQVAMLMLGMATGYLVEPLGVAVRTVLT